MNFSYNDEQLSYRKKIRDFAVEISVDNLQENDANSTFNKSGWLKCGEFGIQGGLIPCEFGGQGLDLLTYISGLELLGELCRDSGLLFSICAHVFACELSILNFGSDEQKRRWLPGLCSGKQIAAIAIAEKQGASDAFDMLTVA
ncbi:MAG TPA: acyl-CoA dehydrogenase family protein, partial [Bacillota bacterium]|nr:acyl-CoA dehydrogenase family protein [Bacillota bacterium]